MADGYIIRVTTPRMDGGAPMRETWYAHIQDRKKAITEVERASGAAATTIVEIVSTVRHAELVDQIKVPEGAVKRDDGQPR